MSREQQKSNTALIIVAVIGVIGTIVASIIGGVASYNVEKLRQETELTRIALVSSVTQSVQGGGVQAATTPQPIYTPDSNTLLMPTTILPTEIGTNYLFENGCIEREFWTPYIQNEILYPTTEKCLELSNLGMSAQNNKLIFFVNNTNVYTTKGIYTPVSRNTNISFTLSVNTPKKYSAKFSYMGFGIGDANADPVNGSFLYYRIDEAPSNTIETGDWWGTFTNKVLQNYSLNQDYNIVISIENNDFSIFVDGRQASTNNLSSNQNYFWISYRVPSDGELQASISNFIITSK